MKVFLLELGVLLSEDSPEYSAYSGAYDKKHGFYDESQEYKSDLESAIKEAKAYVLAGVDNTYAVVSETTISDDFADSELSEVFVEDELYDMESVVFSIAKRGGRLQPNFLKSTRQKEKTALDGDKKVLYDLMNNYFVDCEISGHSEFKTWCEDNLENAAQEQMLEKIQAHVEAIADFFFS